MQLPSELAAAIAQETSAFSARELAAAAAELSQKYRAAKPTTARSIKKPADRAAYLLTRLPATFAAISAALSQTAAQLDFQEIHSLLDLGSGPGTAGFAAAEIFLSLERITFVERDAEMLALGRRLSSASRHPALRESRWLGSDLAVFHSQEKFDLVIAAYVLGELSSEIQGKLIREAWSATNDLLAVIEPGTPRGFKNIIAARNQLIAAGSHIAAPCPHDRTCPLTQIADDWCHFAARVERSSLHRRLKSAELGYEDEKFSYVAFSKHPTKPTLARILRHPRHAKGHIQLELCAQEGLKREVISRKDSSLFRAARHAKWGDSWPPLAEKEE
jgi:ribosomal protein RSM22 (predicted rRNA methylase)